MITLSFTIFLFTWLWTQLAFVHEWIDDLYLTYVLPAEETPYKYILSQIWAHIDCHKCITFWSIMIITWNPILALTFAWLAHVTQK